MQDDKDQTGASANAQEDTSEQVDEAAGAGDKKPVKGNYDVGYCQPPLRTRWKPGQSGNPSGRGKGRLNAKTIVERVLKQKIWVREDDKYIRKPILEAIIYRHASQGEKGDARSAKLILDMLQKTGAWDDTQFEDSNEAPKDKARPSDSTYKKIDGKLLSREELTELSRLSAVIDLGGDVTALSVADFERFKYIVNKGRGKDITPR